MTTASRRRWLSLAAATLAGAGGGAERAFADDGDADLTAAYLYGFPSFEVAALRYGLQYDPHRSRHLPSNVWYHARALATAESRNITAPNADTLYSIALFDLRGGPLSIEIPEMGARYYSIAFIDAYSNDFRYIARRTNGGAAGTYPLGTAPTPTGVALMRILVNGPGDLDAVHRLQDGVRFQRAGALPPAPAPVAPVRDSGENFLAIVNAMLAENPPPAADGAMLERIARAGMGPHASPPGGALRQRWNQRFTALQAALIALVRGAPQRLVNGWSYPPDDIGRFGTDYATRARIALTSFLANVREEDMSLGAVADDGGRALDDVHAYRLHLPARMPVDAFWSLTAYAVQNDGRLFFAENALHRYAIGDRTPGLARNADGSVDILIQHELPAAGPSNWLPLPAAPFRLSLRNYEPQRVLLDGSFRYSPLERAGG